MVGQVMVIGLCLGPIAVTEQYGVALQHAKSSIRPAGIKINEKNRMQTTRIQKSKLQYDLIPTEEPGHRLERMFRSLVAPFPRAVGFFLL